MKPFIICSALAILALQILCSTTSLMLSIWPTKFVCCRTMYIHNLNFKSSVGGFLLNFIDCY